MKIVYVASSEAQSNRRLFEHNLAAFGNTRSLECDFQ